MPISKIDKIHTQVLVGKLEGGMLEFADMRSLLLAMRQYIYNFKTIRDLADFVAHANERNQGYLTKHLRGFELSWRFHLEYARNKIQVDAWQEFPSWIVDLMRHHVEIVDESDLRAKFAIDRNKLRSRVDNAFTVNKARKVATLRNKNIKRSHFESITYLTSFFLIGPVYKQGLILEELLSALKVMGVKHDPDAVSKNIGSLILCLLLQIHQSQVVLNGEVAEFQISARYEYDENFNVDYSKSFLGVDVAISMDGSGNAPHLVHEIFSTNVSILAGCDPTMYAGLHGREGVNFERDLYIVEGRLIALQA